LEDFFFVDRFHGSALHNCPCATFCQAQKNFAYESACLTADNFRNEGKLLLSSQITGGLENAVTLHTDITRTGERGSDLSSEAVLQEYLQFPVSSSSVRRFLL
jgi:hypothetical protein